MRYIHSRSVRFKEAAHVSEDENGNSGTIRFKGKNELLKAMDQDTEVMPFVHHSSIPCRWHELKNHYNNCKYKGLWKFREVERVRLQPATIGVLIAGFCYAHSIN